MTYFEARMGTRPNLSPLATFAFLILLLMGAPAPVASAVHGDGIAVEFVSAASDAERAPVGTGDDGNCMMCIYEWIDADETELVEEDGYYHWFEWGGPGNECEGMGGDPDPDFFGDDGETGCRECGGEFDDCHAEPREFTCGQHSLCSDEEDSLAAHSLLELENLLTPSNGLVPADRVSRLAARIAEEEAVVFVADARELRVRDCMGITRASMEVPERLAKLLRSS